MHAAESMSVPSQSKTRRSKRLRHAASSDRLRGMRERSARQRRLERERARPTAGCTTVSLHACRNMRFSPCRASALLSSKSPYLSSPAIGKPRWARCTRIWCVRPVFSSASSRLQSRARLRAAGRPCAPAAPSSLDARRAARPSRSTYLCSGSLTLRFASRQRPLDERRGRASATRPSRSWRAAPVKRRALLREHQHARGVAVEPVHELEETRVRALARAAARSTPMAHAAAAVHGEPAGLSMTISASSSCRTAAGSAEPRAAPAPGGWRERRAHRRQPQPVARFEPVLGPDPAAVHPHFAAAQDAVDVALRHAFQQPRQVVVDALARAFFAPLHATLRNLYLTLSFAYTILCITAMSHRARSLVQPRVLASAMRAARPRNAASARDQRSRAAAAGSVQDAVCTIAAARHESALKRRRMRSAATTG